MNKLLNHIKTRWNKECSKFGKLLLRISVICGILAPLIGEGGEYFNYLPPGFIPTWVKGFIGLLALYGIIHGKLTVKKEEEPGK